MESTEQLRPIETDDEDAEPPAVPQRDSEPEPTRLDRYLKRVRHTHQLANHELWELAKTVGILVAIGFGLAVLAAVWFVVYLIYQGGIVG